MRIVHNVLEMQGIGTALFKSDESVGLVPTMGALHRGHLSLVNKSLDDNDITIVTIFVNPIQFAPNEDLDSYPHSIKRDIECLEKLKVDYLFIPSKNEIYPQDFCSFVAVKHLKDKLCGKTRPLHFDGVTTICCKLFNLIMPQVAYFGQKDYQQYIIIKQMVKDLNIPLKVKSMPIIRDKDGLALSSRNTYLQSKERKEVANIYRSIKKAEDLISRGEIIVEIIKDAMRLILKESNKIQIEYISISNARNLEEITESITTPSVVLIALAIRIGSTRLIDNSIYVIN